VNPFLGNSNQYEVSPNYYTAMKNEWYIYGSSGHGRFARAFPVEGGRGGYKNEPLLSPLYKQSRYLKHKQYELKDHLGNVRVVVSDLKKSIYLGSSNPPYRAEVLAAYNYYPFGMLQPGMYSENDNLRYRFGFNGMLRDDDVTDKLSTGPDEGRGNSYSTQFRQYDPRVTRWFSLDPLKMKFPWTSPYTGMGNNPVNRIDPLGDADYLTNTGDVMSDGVADNLKFVINNDAIEQNLIAPDGGAQGPPRIDFESLKVSGHFAGTPEIWESIKQEIVSPILPFNEKREDGGAFGLTINDKPIYNYGGQGESYGSGTNVGRAVQKSVNEIVKGGAVKHITSVHSHGYGLSYKPSKEDYPAVDQLRIQSGMMINSRRPKDVYFYGSEVNKNIKFDYDAFNHFMEKK
jgi:RHS repeat-associated protein